MGLNYDKIQRHKRSQDITLGLYDKFPSCKGLYPDCPAEPSLTNSMCRTCPKTEGLKKPKQEE